MELKDQNQAVTRHAELSTIQSVPPPKPTVSTARQVAVKSGVLLVIGAVGAAVYKRVFYTPILKFFSKDPPIKVPDGVIFSVVGGAVSIAALDLARRRKVNMVQNMTRRDALAVFFGAVGAGVTGMLVPLPPVEKDEKSPENAEAEKEPAHSEQNPGENPEEGPPDAGKDDQNAFGPAAQDGFQTGQRQKAFPRAPALTEQDPPAGKKP